MDCAAEEAEIRHALGGLPGIERLRFDLGRRTLAIGAAPQALPAALEALRRIGYAAQALNGGEAAPATACEGACTHDHQPGHRTGHDHDHDHDHGPADTVASSELPRLGAALLLATAAEALAFLAPQALPATLAEMALAAVAIALAGFGTYRKGLAALRHGRLNINALMTVAVTGAFLIGQWPEAAMVMALYAIAELIEARSVDRARHAIQSLLALAPEEAEVRQADGRWQRQPASRVAVGAVVRIRPGERIALDGTVTTGHSAVDQASVTGESIPVDKGPGDEVCAGTVNQASALEIRVTATASNSTLARIIHAVEEAQASRAPTQRWVDRFAAVYTPAVFGLAVAVALLTPLALGWAWGEAVYKALVLLVIACPCALVISTPVTVV
ncbi:MAG: HAD-IC family P-type ATPase, partial [Vitreoscilla sp.]|nr:HAD-IC family P-type ATPase [Vitreoscilla sp.]